MVLVKQSAMEGYQRIPWELCVINLDTLAFNHDQTSIYALDLAARKLFASLMRCLILIHLLQCNFDSSNTLAIAGFAFRLRRPLPVKREDALAALTDSAHPVA